MTHKMKALGVCLVLAFAFSAMAAEGAQATSAHPKCTSGETCVVKVTQHPELPLQGFKLPGLGTVKCKQMHFHYKGAATATESATLIGTTAKNPYTECTFLGLEAEVNFEAVAGKPCDYTLTFPVETIFNSETTISGHATGEIRLKPAGCKVKAVVPGCTLTVEGEQKFPGAVTYTNVKTGERETITGHIDTGETIHATGEGELCPAYSTEKGRTTGTYTAEALNTAETEPVDLTLADT
jgi:hypothetical protein